VLKHLGKRLAVGARGVVLLKPSFELPKVLVPSGGVVESRNLRKLAFNRFKRKAEQYGFRVLERVVSPIRGGAGNVEVLMHVAFDGMPAPRAS
jgi:23S rRNA (cytidine1920-2'-O)/16S rRNA (cytidine1409-2'-O)-methyltransferase